MKKLDKGFYQRPATELVKEFLRKYLVLNTPKGRMLGKIVDIEAYPVFSDKRDQG